MKLDFKKVKIPETKSTETVDILSVKIPKDLLEAVAVSAEAALREKEKSLNALQTLTEEERRNADLAHEFAWLFDRLKTALRT